MQSYAEVFSNLTYQTAVIIFMKKNGEVRLMLGTRNLGTVEIMYGFQGNVLGGHDKRCNIKNGNVAVYDLILGDARSFHIERLIDITYLGEMKTKEDLDYAAERFEELKAKYEAAQSDDIDFSRLD